MTLLVVLSVLIILLKYAPGWYTQLLCLKHPVDLKYFGQPLPPLWCVTAIQSDSYSVRM